jgi:endonuclease/exonuclease/phosphatase family metal-dependent hydrolase
VNLTRRFSFAWFALVLSFSAGCDKNASVDAHDDAYASAEAVSGNPETPSEFTIATYNVNWANRDAAGTAGIVRQANADLVCIQESRPELEQALKRELRREFPHVMFRGDKDRFPAERFGFLSKHPVRKETFLPARHGIFGSWIIEIQLSDRDGKNAGSMIQVANVHLEPIRPPEPGQLLTMHRVFAESEKMHAEEIARIYEHLSPGLPTIVAGDFNSLSSGAAPASLRKRGFADSFAAVTEAPDTKATWRWPTRWLELAGRIDYIFHSSHFRTVSSRIAERTTSDHRLVVSKLEWKRPQ